MLSLIQTNAIPLIFATPILGAMISFILRNRFCVKVVAHIVSFIIVILFGILIVSSPLDGVVLYEMGKWPSPLGIVYGINPLNKIILFLIVVAFFFVINFMNVNLRLEVPLDRHYIYYVLVQVWVAGATGLTLTADSFNLFVCMEIFALSTYGLVALGQDPRAQTSAVKYLFMGSLAASFYLFGIGFAYMLTGTLNMEDLSLRLANFSQDHSIFLLSFVFIIFGLFIKMGLYPFHSWMPNSYTFAPSGISTLFAATTTKIYLYVFLINMFWIFARRGYLDSNTQPIFYYMILTMASMAIIIGAIYSLYTPKLKSLLIWSSVSQIGYIVMVFMLGTGIGFAAGLLQLLSHGLIKLTLFSIAGAITILTMSDNLKDLKGFARNNPYIAILFVLALASIAGFPLTLGFVAKIHILLSIIDGKMWVLIIPFTLGALLGFAYLGRVIYIFYSKKITDEDKSMQDNVGLALDGSLDHSINFKLLIFGCSILVFMNYYLGLVPSHIFVYVENAATYLMSLVQGGM